MTAAAPSLVDLPTELFDTIVEPLDLASLAALTRCCTRLQVKAEPRLYLIIALDDKEDRVNTLLSKFQHDSGLAAYVQSLSFDYTSRSADEDAAKLLPLLPNLQHLNILSPSAEDADETADWAAAAAKLSAVFESSRSKGSGTLTSLRSCTLQYKALDTVGDWPLGSKYNIFLLQQLRTLRLVDPSSRYGTDDEPSWIQNSRWKEPFPPNNLETLQLVDCDIETRLLNRLFEMPRALKHFELSRLNRFRESDRDLSEPSDIESYMKIFSQQRASLETLAVRGVGNINSGSPVPGFADFAALHSLEVAVHFIFGDLEMITPADALKKLPPNLARLRLNYTTHLRPDHVSHNHRLITILHELAQRAPAQFPKLKRVELHESRRGISPRDYEQRNQNHDRGTVDKTAFRGKNGVFADWDKVTPSWSEIFHEVGIVAQHSISDIPRAQFGWPDSLETRLD